MLRCVASSKTRAARFLEPLPAAGARFASLQVPHRGKLFINNQWVDADGGRTFAVSNPATEEELFQCARASAVDIDTAVKGARKCFFGPDWGKQSKGKDRGEMLRKISAGLTEHKEDFSILETLDNGKPITESRADMDACIGLFDFFAGIADGFDDQKEKHIKTSDTDFGVRQVEEPAGVIGMVTPWNFPLMQACAKVAPAIAAGCSMVLKPSSVTPATCLRLGDLALAAGMPAGALQIVSGTGSEAGQALLDHPGTHRLSFTGSSGIGSTVMQAAAKRLVPAGMELGGKGAVVVFDDVNIEATVDWIMIGIFTCSGQTCSATSRLIVQKGVAPKLLARLTEKAKALRIGDTLSDSTQLGSLTSKGQLSLVHGFVERSVKEGGEIICGGKAVPVNGKGYHYEATILRTPPGTEAWIEEIFGPVLAVQEFDTEEEGVRLANDTEYGLGNAVLTADPERCERVAQQLHAGIVWKNCSNALPTEAPFGGFGKSGFGKEYGMMGFHEYIQTKVITSCQPGFSWEWYGGK